MENLHHEERALNKQEFAQQKEALKWAVSFIEQYDKQPYNYLFEIELLEATFEKLLNESWWKRPKQFNLIMGIGTALGQYMVDKMGFEWIVYKDIQGKDRAVKHEASGLICFPISAVRKRLITKEIPFMQEFITNINNELKTMPKHFSKIHYISQGTTSLEHLKAIENACEAGCKWVQLRLKNVSTEAYLETAIQAKKIGEKYGALLTINDNPEVAKASKADGLHLGKEDMAPSEARKIVGDIIVGGTANNWEDILRLSKEGVDYIGLGPFTFTTTKEKLSPVLGIQGFQELLDKMKAHQIHIPVLAIGGIQLENIEALLETGVWGIAVSGLITNAKNAKETVRQMDNLLKKEHG